AILRTPAQRPRHSRPVRPPPPPRPAHPGAAYPPCQLPNRHLLPCRPDGFTFPPLFRAAPGPATAAQLHACALRLGLLHPSVFASGSLVHAYLRFARIADAYAVFDEMPQRDVPAWNAMLSGLCRNARAGDAV
ncbi:unnamed protein product, partial [Urochloa humidicola]